MVSPSSVTDQEKVLAHLEKLSGKHASPMATKSESTGSCHIGQLAVITRCLGKKSIEHGNTHKNSSVEQEEGGAEEKKLSWEIAIYASLEKQ